MTKVTMNLTDRDVDNTAMLQELLHARNKASAVSSALSVATVLATRIKRGEKLYLRAEDGVTETYSHTRTGCLRSPKNSQTPDQGANLDEPQSTVVQDWGDPDGGTEPRARPERLAYETDPTFFRIVGWMLGTAILLSVGGSIFLAACAKDVPEALVCYWFRRRWCLGRRLSF